MNDYLLAALVIFGYGAVGFGLLIVCAIFVDHVCEFLDDGEIHREQIRPQRKHVL